MTDAVVERKDKLKHVPLDAITILERAREDMGNMDELIASIREKGVVQPITLDENLNLLAGGRRLTAARTIGLKTIPCIIRPFIDSLDSMEVELIENIARKDFSWQERCALIKKIHDIQKAKDPDASMRKTAALLDVASGGVSDAIKMAEYLEVIPELKQLGTAHEAFKFIQSLENKAIVDELRKRQVIQIETPPTNSADKNLKDFLRRADTNYQITDCFTEMASHKANGNISFIECDPPYGIDLVKLRNNLPTTSATVAGYEEIPAEDYSSFLTKLANELYRIANRDCWMVFWYGATWQKATYDTLTAAGWHVDEVPAIWVKLGGQTPQPEILLSRNYEQFFVCRKGKPILAKPGRSNVFEFTGCPVKGPDAKYHPTQRPVSLIEELLATFTIGRQVVFVPFLGSGATLRACYNQGLLGYGCDLNDQYKSKFMLAVEEDSKRALAN